MSEKKLRKIMAMALVLLMTFSNVTFAKTKDSKGHWAEQSINGWMD